MSIRTSALSGNSQKSRNTFTESKQNLTDSLKKAGSTKQSEKELQHDIFEWFKHYTHRYKVWRHHAGGRVGQRRTRASFADPSGISDIMGFDLRIALILGIEVKGPSGKVSTDQSEFGNMILSAGGVFIVAFCLDDVVNRLG